MTTFTASEVNACCADVYSHPAARFLLGDSLHPGGLALTEELAGRMNLEPGMRVLDAGCGQGASALMLAQKFGCDVTGVTLEAASVAELESRAAEAGISDRVRGVQGDVTAADLPHRRFDVAIAECVVSIFPRKQAALENIAAALRPGGRLGITDVTVEGGIPASLQGIFAVAGCVGGAISLGGYAALVERTGFRVDHTESLPDVAGEFLRGIRKKLMLAEIGAGLGKLPVDRESVRTAKSVLAEAESLVESGALGYGLVVATRR